MYANALTKKIFKTTSSSHPGVKKLNHAKKYLVAGNIAWIGKSLATFKPYLTPKETRALFKKKKWKNIVAFHTRNAPHRGHEHVQRAALKKVDEVILENHLNTCVADSIRKGNVRESVGEIMEVLKKK